MNGTEVVSFDFGIRAKKNGEVITEEFVDSLANRLDSTEDLNVKHEEKKVGEVCRVFEEDEKLKAEIDFDESFEYSHLFPSEDFFLEAEDQHS